MRRNLLLNGIIIAGMALLFTNVGAEEGSPIAPCVSCHSKETPAIVKQWQAGKHNKVGVKCYVCHFAEEGDKTGADHHGFRVTPVVQLKTCAACHPEAKKFKRMMLDREGNFNHKS